MSEQLLPVGTRFIFDSPYQYGPTGMSDADFDARKGTEAEVVEQITEPDDDIDAEVLPMYRIQFLADGLVIAAWPEEVQS